MLIICWLQRMKKNALIAALVLGGVALCLCLVYPQIPGQRAKRLNARMYGTHMGEEWFALLLDLSATVENPEDYLRSLDRSWRKTSEVELARRLLHDNAREFLPGLINILRITPPVGDDIPEGYRGRHAALVALSSVGKQAEPALPELVEAVKNDPENAQFAIEAVGNIGSTNTADLLAACLDRDDLKYWDKDTALRALKYQLPALPSDARDILLQVAQTSDPETSRRAVVALGWHGDIRAIPKLISLLREDLLYFRKSEISDTLKRFDRLPDCAMVELRALHEQKTTEVSKYAAWVLQDIEKKEHAANKAIDNDKK